MGCHDTYNIDIIDQSDVVYKVILSQAASDRRFDPLYKVHQNLIQINIVLAAGQLKACVIMLLGHTSLPCFNIYVLQRRMYHISTSNQYFWARDIHELYLTLTFRPSYISFALNHLFENDK